MAIKDIKKKEDYIENIILHLVELRKTLKIMLFSVIITFIILYPFSTLIINYLWKLFFINKLQLFTYIPSEIIFIKIKVISYISILINFPLLIYELFKFIERGLKKNEYNFLIKIIPYSFMLFIISLVISSKILIPLFIKYILLYSNKLAIPQIGLKNTLDTVIIIIIGFSIIFQVPLILPFILKMELISKKKIELLRIPIYILLISFSLFIIPNSTLIVRLVILLILILLFEICLKIDKYF